MSFKKTIRERKNLSRMTRVTAPEAKEFSLGLFVSKMSLWIWFTGEVRDEKFCKRQIRSILK